MPVFLPTSVLGNDQTLLTLGSSGEIMGWFYPAKDHAQQIHECLPAVFCRGQLHWTWSDIWQRQQQYLDDSNILQTVLTSESLGARLTLLDLVPVQGTILLRRIGLENIGDASLEAGIFHFGDWNLGGFRQGNALLFNRARQMLVQNHREAALAVGGDALHSWSCGKAGPNWGNNSKRDLEDGALNCNDLEIGDVCWAFGAQCALEPGHNAAKTAVFSLAPNAEAAMQAVEAAQQTGFESLLEERRKRDAQWLSPGLQTLQEMSPLPDELLAAYKRSLLALPLLCGPEGAALAAPEFDPEFISCGGYGYLWPRDGGEYVSGLIDAGYPQFAQKFFDWCARHQDPSGLWHQRYFLNGAPGPNWCLPPDMLQIDQVGAVLWAFGKWQASQTVPPETSSAHRDMIRRAADYLLSRQTPRGVHGNAFDTWETFIGSFTYSNAAIYAAFLVAARECDDSKYFEAARRVKEGMLTHFVREKDGYRYLTRGFDGQGNADATIDSSSLGAIEPFGLLDLNDEADLDLAIGTLRAMRETLEVDWMGGRAIRRFEGDAYVGGVPACVNTLWMARCCLHVGARLRELNRTEEANELRDHAALYLKTVLRRATPTGLLPELMQGPTGQSYWAAPHGWAMASFVSGALMLAKQMA